MKIGEIKILIKQILSRFAPKSRTWKRVKIESEIISLEEGPQDKDYKEAKAE